MVYSALKGRIGNNLFQIAAGISLAKQNNTDFAACIQNIMLPEPDYCLLSKYLTQFKDNILRNIILLNEIPQGSIKYNEQEFSYDPIKYENNILLDGYFQSEKYFDGNLIKNIFSIDETTKKYILGKFGHLFTGNITSINVRRGDFLMNPENNPVCSVKYYFNAINYIGNRNYFLIISDDIQWCKKKFKGNNFFFIEDENPVVDLYLQSFCTNNIISNSSFSWWGAWLNGNPHKIVIAPRENWFGVFQSHLNTKDLIPKEWVKISNPIEFSLRLRVFLSSFKKLLVSQKKRLKKYFISQVWKRFP